MNPNSNLSIFEYSNNTIRVVIIDGEPWFVAKDVCDILEHSNARKAVSDLVDGEDMISVEELTETERVTSSDPLHPQTKLVNEAGVYSLVFGSRKPEAKAFKRWITREVLPSIRKTGHYSVKSIFW